MYVSIDKINQSVYFSIKYIAKDGDEMKKGDQSKHHLIECAARLFWHDGYNATGINKILQESEMTKGSFYFYFKTKKELAAAVISYYQQVIFEWLQELSQDTQWEEFVRQFSSRMLKDAADGRHYGCPFAVVGMEIAFAEPDISPCYAAALETVAALFRRVLEQSGVPSSHSATLADRLFSIYEGELLRYRISKDPVYIKNLGTQLIGTYWEYRKIHSI